MTLKGPYLLLVVLAFAGGIALGTLLGGPRLGASRASSQEEHEPARRPPAGDGVALAASLATALEPSLLELRRAIAALATALERRPTIPRASDELPVTTRAPMDNGPSLDSAALASAIARLADAVQVLERGPRTQGARPALNLVAPTWVDRTTAFASAGLRDAARVDDDETLDKARTLFQQQHILWSTQDLLTSYGKPDTIEVNGDQAQWTYEIEFRGGEEYYHFYVHDETVIQTDYDWDFFD